MWWIWSESSKVFFLGIVCSLGCKMWLFVLSLGVKKVIKCPWFTDLKYNVQCIIAMHPFWACLTPQHDPPMSPWLFEKWLDHAIFDGKAFLLSHHALYVRNTTRHTTPQPGPLPDMTLPGFSYTLDHATPWFYHQMYHVCLKLFPFSCYDHDLSHCMM